MLLLPDDKELCKQIQNFADSGMPVAQLEYVGLSARAIGILECSDFNCVYLKDLIKLSVNDIISIRYFGKEAITEIRTALKRISELETIRNRWHKSSSRVDFYMKRIPLSYVLR